jgi:D-alanine-D-alanine ligase
MKSKIRVGLIFGGRSGEHEVSLASARSVMTVLDPEKYEVVQIGITHDGRWLTQGNPLAQLTAARAALLADGTPATPAPSDPPATAGRELVPGATGSTFPPLDVIFPILHGPYGEDGTVQGLLELAGVAYVGCGVLASSVGMDKIVCKQLFEAHGIPVVPYCTTKRRDWETQPDAVIADIEARLPYPLFVKPANLGSSIGISKATHREELRHSLAEAARYDRKLLIEAAVAHPREIECSVLGNDDPLASVPGEIVPSKEFYDYEAKYLDGRSDLVIPAPLPVETAAQVRALAVQAFLALDAAGLARVDFLLERDTGRLYLNEVNTIPGFTSISMYPKLWEASGLSYAELVDRLIELALERHADKARSLTRYEDAM